MEIQELKMNVVMLLLLNKNNTYSDGYSLIKILSRWFGIIDFSNLAERMIEEGFLICKYINQIGHYTLTDKAIAKFKLNKILFEKEAKLHYPNQIERLEVLFENLKL